MTDTSMLDELRDHPQSFSFLQATRVLDQAVRRGAISSFRIRPELSVDTPASDVRALLLENDGQKAVLEVGIMGLYGASSPLPGHYNEQLIRLEQADVSAVRLLLDVFHQRMFSVLSAIQRNDHHGLGDAGHDDDLARGWHAFSGEPRGAQGLRLELASLYRLPYRSADGLRLILDAFFADLLGGEGRVQPVKIEQFSLCHQRIQEQDRLRLGPGPAKRLGIDTVLGERVADRSTVVVIKLGPVTDTFYQRLTTEAAVWTALVKLVQGYAGCAWEYLLDVAIEQEAMSVDDGLRPAGRLGVSVWLGRDPSAVCRHALIRLADHQASL
jgi:type VI secretion system protein ImpH